MICLTLVERNPYLLLKNNKKAAINGVSLLVGEILQHTDYFCVEIDVEK